MKSGKTGIAPNTNNPDFWVIKKIGSLLSLFVNALSTG
ncbi:UNVERIFIED_ORG: hypothetical protein DFS12_105134 [Chitinophaga ginsengisegetis]|nr:hypothetical protein [Chitinophaga ginsengisegetis]MDR6648691.1 hypothetical protein [Chitinophaga ginsengisegetis]MDR6655361.1 hypothetical protein [Chitinophaga ginsengisegetis]